MWSIPDISGSATGFKRLLAAASPSWLRHPWAGPAVLFLGLMVLAVVTLWRHNAATRLADANAALAAVYAQATAVSAASGPLAAPITDFVQKLPATTFIDPVVRDLQRFSASAGVVFVSIDATPREASTRSLGRVEAVVVLRGTYANLKSVLSQLLDRHANLVVQRLSLRRLNGPSDVEASAGLLQLSRPAATGATR